MKTLLAAFLTLLSLPLFAGDPGIPYVIAPTNSPVDTYVVSRSGNKNKWVPYATSTNAITNMVIRPGLGVTIDTNVVGVDYTVNSTNWVYDALSGGMSNSLGPVEVINTTLQLKGTSGALIFTNMLFGGANKWLIKSEDSAAGISFYYNLVRMGILRTDGTLTVSNLVTPTNTAAVGNVLIATNTSGQSVWGDFPVGGIAAGTNIVLTTNGTTVTVNVANTNLPVVSAGTNVTVVTNGLNYIVSATATNGGGADNLWTNDISTTFPLGDNARILRPVDQSRSIQIMDLTSTNFASIRAINGATNDQSGMMAFGTYSQNRPATAGTNALYYNAGQVGMFGETLTQSGGVLVPGDAVGVMGWADFDWALSMGVVGVGAGNVSASTNIGGAFAGLYNDGVNKGVGIYAETANYAVSDRSPVITESSVAILNSKASSTNPIIIGQSNNVQVFRVDKSGNLSEVRDVLYEWPRTNASAGQGLASDGGSPQQLYWTNFGTGGATGGVFVAAGTNITLVTNSSVVTISVSTNPVVIAGTNVTIQTNGLSYTINSTGGAASIGPGTPLRHAMFSSTTNVGDSILFQPATNQLEMRMTNTSFSAVQSNLIYGAYTNATGWRATEISVDPAGYTRIEQLLGSAVDPATFPRSGLRLNEAWMINGWGTTQLGDGGGKSPDLLPIGDNVHDIGSTAARVRTITTGPLGYLTYDIASGSQNFRSETYGLGFHSTGIGMYLLSGPNFIAGVQREASTSIYALTLGSSYLASGAAQSFAMDTYQKRGFQAGAWQFGTNNSSGTAQPTAYLHGGKANGTDKPGDKIYLASGPSTGTGTPGAVGIATAEAATTTGSSENTSYYARYYVSPKVITLTTNADTLVFNFTIPTALRSAGGIVHVHTEIRDATDIASIDEQFAISALRKGATVTCTNSVSGPISGLATGAAGMTTTWTVVANSQSVDVKCKVVTTGINATTAETRGTFFLNSSAVPLITW